MTWLRIDDCFIEHEKIESLSHQAFRLHVAGLCFSARLLTDGRIGSSTLKKAAVAARIRSPKAAVAELVEARLWIELKDGWKIKDYLDYNPSAEHVKDQRRKAAERQARFRQSNAVTNAVSNASPSRPVIDQDLPTRNGHVGAAFHKLLRTLGPVDEEAMTKLRGFDARLPEASIARVTESVVTHRPRNRVGYALKALSSELAERNSA